MRFLVLAACAIGAARAQREYGNIIYATSQPLFDGDRGSRQSADTECGLLPLATALSCGSVHFLASYSNSPAAGLPWNLSALVLAPYGQLVAVNASLLFAGRLNQTLAQAGVMPAASLWWSGSLAGGVAADNCDDWTTSITGCINGYYGSSDYLDSRWLSAALGECSKARYLLCLCVDGEALRTSSPSSSPSESPTRSPTRAPSSSPTHAPSSSPTQKPSYSPTASPSHRPSKSPSRKPTESPSGVPSVSPSRKPSKSPSKSPSRSAPTRSPSHRPTVSPSPVVTSTMIFRAPLNLVSGSDTNLREGGAMGSRASTTAWCNALATFPPTCRPGTAVSFLAYSGGDDFAHMPATYGLPPGLPVLLSTGVQIAASWTDMLSMDLQNSFATLLADEPSIGVNIWLGTDVGGTTSTNNCGDWAVTGDSGTYVADTSTQPFTISNGAAQCTFAISQLCACASTYTSSPTARPSVSPATALPSASPTTAKYIMYSDSTARPAALGARASSSSLCTSSPAYPPACTGSAVAYLCYSSDAANNIPTDLGHSFALPVVSVTGAVIATSYSNLYNGLSNTLASAAVFSPTSALAWTGCGSAGTLSGTGNCADWTSTSAPSATVTTNPATTNAGWQTRGVAAACSAANALLCVCYGDAPTGSPTPYPGRVVFFSDAAARQPLFASRSAADAICNGMSGAYPVDCHASAAHAVLCMSSSDTVANMPSNYGFSAALRSTVGTSATTVATSWTNLLTGAFSNSLSAAGLGSVQYWTGCNTDGSEQTAHDCGTWAQTSSSFDGYIGSSSSASTAWIDTGTAQKCNVDSALLCMCVAYQDTT